MGSKLCNTEKCACPFSHVLFSPLVATVANCYFLTLPWPKKKKKYFHCLCFWVTRANTVQRKIVQKVFTQEPLREPHTPSLLTPYISLPHWGWVTFSIPTLMSSKSQGTFCDHLKSKRQFCFMQLTVLHQPTFYGFLRISLDLTPYKCALADMIELYRLRHKNVKGFNAHISWGWTREERMSNKGPLPKIFVMLVVEIMLFAELQRCTLP